jgi:hypothetical protein
MSLIHSVVRHLYERTPTIDNQTQYITTNILLLLVFWYMVLLHIIHYQAK